MDKGNKPMWLTFRDLLILLIEVQITHIITCSPSFQGRVNDYQSVFLHMLWSGHIFCMAKYFTVSFVNIYKIDCKDIHKKINKHYTPQVILLATLYIANKFIFFVFCCFAPNLSIIYICSNYESTNFLSSNLIWYKIYLKTCNLWILMKLICVINKSRASLGMAIKFLKIKNKGK